MKAKLPTFTGSTKCQLCHLEEGTLLHRHYCASIVPGLGWTKNSDRTCKHIESLTHDRAHAMRTRAVLTVSIPVAQPQVPTPGWRWITSPPDAQRDDLTWVIDGSRRYGSSWTPHYGMWSRRD